MSVILSPPSFYIGISRREFSLLMNLTNCVIYIIASRTLISSHTDLKSTPLRLVRLSGSSLSQLISKWVQQSKALPAAGKLRVRTSSPLGQCYFQVTGIVFGWGLGAQSCRRSVFVDIQILVLTVREIYISFHESIRNHLGSSTLAGVLAARLRYSGRTVPSRILGRRFLKLSASALSSSSCFLWAACLTFPLHRTLNSIRFQSAGSSHMPGGMNMMNIALVIPTA